jgi:PhnB protein
MIEPDTKADADKIFAALSEDGSITMPLQDMFWGAYYGSCTDKFGVQWMINISNR